jgi:hypothetical protein
VKWDAACGGGGMYSMPVTFIQVGPPGYFHTYFYNRARRLRLEKLLYLGLSIIEAPTDFLNYLWIQVASEAKRPLHSRFGSETVTNL